MEIILNCSIIHQRVNEFNQLFIGDIIYFSGRDEMFEDITDTSDFGWPSKERIQFFEYSLPVNSYLFNWICIFFSILATISV